jgi:methylmalonyl-CoA mutase N-terminal domain/subunit
MSSHRLPERDRPWMMRTYAGHSTAKKSNELYRGNLAKGQTGLSIAFDLPTQTATTPTTSSRAARSARWACPSPTAATWRPCSTGSRSTS